MLEPGQKVAINYAGQLDNGYEFVNTWLSPDPVTVEIGSGGLLPAFERELATMERGERKRFVIPCASAYGARDPEAVVTVAKDGFPHADELPVGAYIEFDLPEGRARAKVVEVGGETVTFDLNHELAGYDLSFEVELLDDGKGTALDSELSATGCGCNKLRETLTGKRCDCC